MKALIACVTIMGAALAFTGAAKAAFAPLDLRTASLSSIDTTIDSGPSGASLESDYFRAPPKPYAAGRLLPCRLQVRIFDKTRVAQLCN